MSEMVERVARALAKRADDDFEANVGFWTEYARAAIEAMAEPTDSMRRAAWIACERGRHTLEPYAGWAEYNERVYRAMVNAALNEPMKERQP